MLAIKTVAPERILQAADLGYTTVGENRIKEAKRKLNRWATELGWHYIGHMQSNKVNKGVSIASMVQPVNRLKIVRKMNHRLKKIKKTMDVLIQVNTSGEGIKYGIDPLEATEFVKRASKYKRLNIKGLMTIGLFSDDWPEVRKGFAQLRQLRLPSLKRILQA